MDALPHWQNDPCHNVDPDETLAQYVSRKGFLSDVANDKRAGRANVSPTLVEGVHKFHTHVEENGDVLVCSTTGSRLYRWISDLGLRRVHNPLEEYTEPLPGELLAVSDLFPLSFG